MESGGAVYVIPEAIVREITEGDLVRKIQELGWKVME